MPRRLILASASPRRRELLGLLGLPFAVIPSHIAEEVDPGLSPHQIAGHLAYIKAREIAGSISISDSLVLGADTIVVAGQADTATVLGKPADAEAARDMLRRLSAATHTVLTGIALLSRPDDDFESCTRVVDTQVTFRELTPTMIDAYISTGEPFDKAGAYGIQGYASAFVEAIYGDYFNVVGLPVQTVGRMLESIGIEWWRGADALT